MVKEKELKELQHRIKALEEERDGLLDAGEDIHALANFQERIGPLANKQEIIDVLLESICISKDLPYASYIGALNGFYKVKSEYINDDVQGLLGREYKGEEAGLLIKASRVKKLCSRGRDVSDPIGFFPKNPERDVDYFCLIPMGPKGMAHGIVAVCTFEGDISFQHQTVPLLERLASTATSKIESLELMKTIEDLNIKLRERLGKKKIELKRSEESYRTLVEGASDAIVTIDPEGNVSSWNKAAQRMLGYEPEEVIGKPAAMLTPEELRDEQKEVIIKVKETGFVDGYETIRMATDGTKVPVEMTVSAMKDENGEVVGLSAILRDITERKKAEEALLESEERFRKIFEEGPLGMIITGLDFRFVNVNPTLSRMLGYTEQELLKLSFPDITHPDDVGQDVENAKKLMRGEIPIYRTEKRYIRKDKHVLWINLTATLIRSEEGKPQYFLTMVEDITERKRVEEALEESEEWFKQFFENEPAYCYMISPESIILDVNKAALKALGYRKEELVGKHLKTIYAPESLPQMKENLEEWRKTGMLKEVGMDIITKKGERRTVLLSASAVKDKDGKPLHSVSVQRDITERKKAEEALRESEEKYRRLVELANDGIIITQDGKLKFANAMLAKQFGYTIEEIIDTNFLDYVFPDDRPKVLERHNRRVQGEDVPSIYEMRVLQKDGRSIYIEINSGVITYKGKPAVFSFVRDITERKQMEEALQESEEKFRNLFNYSNDGIFLHDLEGNIIDINQKGLDKLGYSRSEALSLNVANLHPPEAHEMSVGAFEKIASDGFVQFEIDFKKKNGEIFPAEVSSSLFEIDGKKVIQGIVRDITERKKAEERINELNKDLELKVRERTAEVEDQKEELTVANEELTLMNEELIAAQDEPSELNRTLEKKVEERTEQWRLSEKVSTSLGRVIEESLNEIFVFDSETLQFINVNRGARENLGYTMKELKNLTPLDLKPEFTPEQFNELIKPLRTGEKEKIVFNTVHKRKDGSLYDVEVHLQHSTFGNQSAFIAVILDITDRKRAEDEIKERMEDIEILNAIISAVSSTLDPVEVFHRITQSAAELIGGDAASLAFYDEEKGVMTYPYHYNMTKKLTQVVAEKGRGLAEPVMKTRKGVIIEDYPSHPRALKEFVDAGLRVLIAVPLISKDRAFGALGVFGLKRGKRFTEHDLKLLEGVGKEVAVAIENARLYQEIKDFSKTLEKNVRERTRELEDAKNSLLNLVEDLEEVNLKLQEADRLKSVFLATMSHELRTPLNSIIGFTGILLQDMAGKLNPEQKKQLNMVYSSAKQLLSLINDLLDVSRIEAGKIEVSPEEFALKDFVDEVTLSFTRAIEEKGIVLSKEVEDAVLNTDRRRAGQVLMNLLENAVKFTKKGSIKVTAKRVDGRVIFSVEDTGIGIRKTDWTKVFEPFQQIELPKGIKKDGTGIGLYLSRKIAHCLGGDLSFESRYGKGSIFTFTIPRVYQKN